MLMIVVINVGCDQITKNIVRQEIGYSEHIMVINHLLTLTKIENSGAFLSLGDSLAEPLKFILLTLLPCMAMAFGLYFLFSKTNAAKMFLVGLCFVIGGGIGNLYDRLLYGSVTDFLHMDFVIFQTGIFNMADVSIMVGMGILIIHTYLMPKLALSTDANREEDNEPEGNYRGGT